MKKIIAFLILSIIYALIVSRSFWYEIIVEKWVSNWEYLSISKEYGIAKNDIEKKYWIIDIPKVVIKSWLTMYRRERWHYLKQWLLWLYDSKTKIVRLNSKLTGDTLEYVVYHEIWHAVQYKEQSRFKRLNNNAEEYADNIAKEFGKYKSWIRHKQWR